MKECWNSCEQYNNDNVVVAATAAAAAAAATAAVADADDDDDDDDDEAGSKLVCIYLHIVPVFTSKLEQYEYKQVRCQLHSISIDQHSGAKLECI